MDGHNTLKKPDRVLCGCTFRMARWLSTSCEEFRHLICMMSKITSGVMEQLDVNLSPCVPSLCAPCMNSDGNLLRLCWCESAESLLPHLHLVSGREACSQESRRKKKKKICRFFGVFFFLLLMDVKEAFSTTSLWRLKIISVAFYGVSLQCLDASLVC